MFVVRLAESLEIRRHYFTHFEFSSFFCRPQKKVFCEVLDGLPECMDQSFLRCFLYMHSCVDFQLQENFYDERLVLFRFLALFHISLVFGWPKSLNFERRKTQNSCSFCLSERKEEVPILLWWTPFSTNPESLVDCSNTFGVSSAECFITEDRSYLENARTKVCPQNFSLVYFSLATDQKTLSRQ